MCGRLTDDRTRLSLERFSVLLTLPLAGMGSRCRRNHSTAGESIKSKSLTYNKMQPWPARSCRILQREQSGSSQALLTELCTTGDVSLLLTAGPVTTTSVTRRLTQQYQTTTTLPLSRATRMSLCSHRVSNCLREVVFGRRWLSHAMSRAHNVAVQCPSPTISTHLGNSFEDQRISGQLVLDMLTLENDVFQRCLSAQPVPTALQRFNRCKCAHFLRHLAAAADLPPNSALFSLQLLDLTHSWWSEAEDPTSTSTMSIPLRQRLTFALNCTLIRPHFSFQIPLTDLLTTLAAVLGSRQPHNVPLLHSAQTVHEVVAEECRILESVNYELVTYTPTDWVSLFEVRFSLRVQQRSPQVTGSLLSLLSGVPSGVLVSGALYGSSRA